MSSESGAAMAQPRELVITRFFDAPRERVFKAWTQPEILKRWCGPRGFTTPVYTVDLRPGGKQHFCMLSPEGQEIWCVGTYHEIVEPERIVCTDSFSDKDGNTVDPAKYEMPAEWPREALVTTEFTEEAGRTKLTLHLGVSEELADRVKARQGWTESLDRLAECVVETTGASHGSK